jgi:hypothetical protein
VVCVFSVCYVILRVRIELDLRTFCRDMGPPVRLSGRVFAVWGRTVLSTGIFIHSFIHCGKLVTRHYVRLLRPVYRHESIPMPLSQHHFRAVVPQ